MVLEGRVQWGSVYERKAERRGVRWEGVRGEM